jgi:hypothetical protein
MVLFIPPSVKTSFHASSSTYSHTDRSQPRSQSARLGTVSEQSQTVFGPKTMQDTIESLWSELNDSCPSSENRQTSREIKDRLTLLVSFSAARRASIKKRYKQARKDLVALGPVYQEWKKLCEEGECFTKEDKLRRNNGNRILWVNLQRLQERIKEIRRDSDSFEQSRPSVLKSISDITRWRLTSKNSGHSEVSAGSSVSFPAGSTC